MKRVLKRLPLGAFALLGLLQLVPVDRSNPPVENDFTGPPGVREVFRAKCYDCHSNETTWPWYSHVAPVSWWVADHVHEGRAALNFSRWGAYSPREREAKAGEIYDEVLDKLMPLPSYLVLHPRAEVTPEELALIERWLDGDVGASPP
jgi:hypothetical protein